ncbi:unnamed protein product [Lymnaea stagnalis]|uniref:RING-type domain-containing protein n=1 Tax=Lymnaea stagnalis TaxID=6523 RepID=A0AAV2IB27_LYMST
MYRLGSNGKVDLKLVTNCYGNFYYKSHLPLVGKLNDETIENNYFQKAHISADRRKSSTNGKGFESKNHREPFYHVDNMRRKNKEESSQPHVNSAYSTRGTGSNYDREAGPSHTSDRDSDDDAMTEERSPPAKKSGFKIGDNVKIAVGLSALKKLQDGHGGFPSNMMKHVAKVGTVFSINDNGDVKVKFGDSGPYLFNPDALSKILNDPKSTGEPTPTTSRAEPTTRLKPECTICLTQEACAAFVPCGHIACCQRCSKFFKKCPICRGEVKTSFRVFIP